MNLYVVGWQDRFSIGIEEIDAQHRRLIELIEKIPATHAAESVAEVRVALDFAEEHFRKEEGFMARIGYPGLQDHSLEHKLLGRILAAHHREFQSGKTDLESFRRFMFRWVVDHIVEDDRRIGQYVLQRTL